MGWTIALLLVFAGGLAAALCAEWEKDRRIQCEFKAILDRLADDVGDPTLRQAFLYAIRQPKFARVSKQLHFAAYEIALVYLAANSGQVSRDRSWWKWVAGTSGGLGQIIWPRWPTSSEFKTIFSAVAK